MRTITINIKYSVGDRVWIMLNDYPICLKIAKINIQGGNEDKDGVTCNLGRVTYYLSNDEWKAYSEEQLCDTFEELRDKVFSDDMRGNVEQDEEEESDVE